MSEFKNGGGSASSAGFWGEPTANIEWCEEKYYISNYIAEFWNSLSNMPFIFLSIISLYQLRKINLKKRFSICYLMICAVGLGSFLFHATLLYEAQLMDELPMMLMIGQATFCLFSMGDGHSKKEKGITALIIYSGIAVSTSIYIIWNEPLIFHVIFGFFVAVCIFSSIKLSRTIKKSRGGVVRGISIQRGLVVSATLNIAGFIFWYIDLVHCSSLKAVRGIVHDHASHLFQFHAWWHILTASGVSWFVACLIVIDDHHKDVHENKSLGRTGFFFPKVVIGGSF